MAAAPEDQGCKLERNNTPTYYVSWDAVEKHNTEAPALLQVVGTQLFWKPHKCEMCGKQLPALITTYETVKHLPICPPCVHAGVETPRPQTVHEGMA